MVTTFVSRGVPLHRLLAPAVGFEPTTNRLTADRSTTELRWNVFRISSEGRAYTLRAQARAASGNRIIPTLTGLYHLATLDFWVAREGVNFAQPSQRGK